MWSCPETVGVLPGNGQENCSVMAMGSASWAITDRV